MAKVYIFDFDGVVVSNLAEIEVICKDVWRRLGEDVSSVDWKKFVKMRPYIKNAMDWYGLLRLLQGNNPVTRNAIKKIATSESEKTKKFGELFFEEREKLQNLNLKEWLNFYEYFDFVLDLIRDVSKTSPVYIVSNKDKRSIEFILQHVGINLPTDHVFGREQGLEKNQHIRSIIKNENILPSDIIFIDDSIDHAKLAKETGVKPVLASWGYVIKEDVESARSEGIRVATKENFREITETEYFDVVDENDNVIGRASRDECHKKGLLHRAVHVVILNSKGEMLLQKRSMDKDLFPGWWIDASAGHVDSGETYEEAAKREMKEEIGVVPPIKQIMKFKRRWEGNGKIDDEIIVVYLARCNGPFVANEEEVEFLRFFSLEEVFQMINKENFTPASRKIISELHKRPELLKSLDLL